MGATLNKVFLIGRLGKDPELKQTPGGTSVCTFSLATDEGYKDKSGNRVDKTEWHNIVAWGKLGDIAGQYLKKGKQAYIEGKLSTRSWEDKNGVRRYRTDITALQIIFMGAAGEAPQRYSEHDVADRVGVGGEPIQYGSVEDDEIPF